MLANELNPQQKNLFGEALRDLYDQTLKEPFFIGCAGEEEPLDLAFYLEEKIKSHEAEALHHVRGRILDVGC